MKTAVEWLDEQLQDTMYIQYGYVNGVRKVVMPLEDYMKFKQEALELEKEQITDAYVNGEDNIDNYGCSISKNGAETYFAETYGSKGSDVTSSQTEISDEIWLSIDGRKLMANKPIEISDEEIEKGADYYGDRWIDAREAFYGFLEGAKWYREQVKSRQ